MLVIMCSARRFDAEQHPAINVSSIEGIFDLSSFGDKHILSSFDDIGP